MGTSLPILAGDNPIVNAWRGEFSHYNILANQIHYCLTSVEPSHVYLDEFVVRFS